MNNHERRRLDAETADRLLAGDPTARTGFERLADRLSAASVAAFPGELAGEAHATAAFLAAADADPAPRDRRSSMLKAALAAKLLTLKAAAVAVAVVSIGGVALAATTDVLPNPFAPQDSHPTPAPSRSNGPDASPSPSLKGLCTAYLAGAGDASENVLENPAFSALVRAAGGTENIVSFCAELGVTATARPTGGAPTDIPGGRPSELPTPSHPTGQPTALPTPSHP